jgi:fumarylacetoacetase
LRVAGDWGLDIELEIELSGTVVSRANARELYWTMPQQLAHATVNGASIATGDLFASGTISGPEHGSEGSLIELTWNGSRPIRLGDGSTRTFLEDGDEVVIRGRAGELELGEVRGTILPAGA